MGQVLNILSEQNVGRNDNEREEGLKTRNANDAKAVLPDLALWPPELSLAVLSNLNATDLCLASCVWQQLARDEVLWNSLCVSQWGYTSIYRKDKPANFSYHRLYLQLDEGTVTFAADPILGMNYFFSHQLVDNDPNEVAKFFLYGRNLKRSQMKKFLYNQPEIVDCLVKLQTFDNSLPDSLRNFFSVLQAPNRQDNYLENLLDKFSNRFCECNPTIGLTKDMVYILCYSLIMLSVDLSSPHVKNKMSKREFIKNLRHALQKMDDDLFGHLYDNIYTKGHIAPQSLDNND